MNNLMTTEKVKAARLSIISNFDSVAAIAVALLIIKSSFDLTRDALGDIFDKRLPLEDETRINEIFSRHQRGRIRFHRLRSRKSGSMRFVDLHLVVPRKWSIA